MFEVDAKMEMFMDMNLWNKAIQKLIDKGVRPEELMPYTTPEFRAKLAEVMLSGEYRVAPPHIAKIPKGNGEFREVYVNTVVDRLVLSIINEVYNQMYDFMIHPKCVSYQKHIGVKNIIRQITKEIGERNIQGYKIDISKYFDSVSKETLMKQLQKIDTNSCIDEIVKEYYSEDLIMDEDNKLLHHYKSLAQGCAVSAFLANTILADVDAAMDKMCNVYYRYSDDIIIIGNREKALKKLTEMLKEKGLKINPKKVESLSCDEWFTFLGCNIKGNLVSFSEKSIKNIQREVKKRLPKKPSDLKKSIKKINTYLYTAYLKNSSAFGWAEYFFSIVNCEKDIVTIDTWIKDILRGYYRNRKKVGGLGCVKGKDYVVARGTGRNVTANLHKTEGVLEANGYVSMHHLYKVYQIDKDVYRAEIARCM